MAFSPKVSEVTVTDAIVSKPGYDQAHTTKVLCILGLCFSTLVGTSLVILGATAQGTSKLFEISSITAEVITLGLNFVILACTEPLGMIHSTSLRWALFREHRLDFNGNLRLLTFSKTSVPNGIIANTLYLLSLAMCYAASPLVLVKVTYEAGSRVEIYSYCLSKAGPLCLGIALLVQCAICTYCLLDSAVPTWNPNPLVTLAVALESGALRSKSRCLTSVHDRERPDEPRKPLCIQDTAHRAHPSVLWVLAGLSVVMIAVCIWAGIIIVIAHHNKQGTNWAFFPVLKKGADQSPLVILNFFSDKNYDRYLSETGLFAALLFTVLIQSFLTIGAHCAELQVILARDEMIWRSISTQKGSKACVSAISSALGSWQSFILMCFKPLIHWFYGLAMYVDYGGGIVMFGPQITYLVLLWAVFVGFVWFVSCRKPVGYLPATYGHLKTMVDIVDEWHPAMFWGDKGMTDLGCRHAGTSASRLPPVDPSAWYMGIDLSAARMQG